MKIVNGKLFGQTKNDLEVFKEQIEQRCQSLEISLSNEQRQQIETYKQGLEKIYYLQQVLGKKLQTVENKQLESFESNLVTIKQNIPTKLLWLSFSTSLIIGAISLMGLLGSDAQYECQANSEPIRISTLTEEKLADN